jgi:hypothetical protein
VQNTIDQLRLNSSDFIELRGEYVDMYRRREMVLARLERRAPFVARELRRQGRLHPDDQSAG